LIWLTIILRTLNKIILAETQLYDEKKLLQQVSSGDAGAYKKLYLQYEDDIYKLVLRYVKSPQLSQDLTQDIFLKVWEKREKLSHVEFCTSYLRSFARNYTINALEGASKSRAALGEIMRQKHTETTLNDDVVLDREYRDFVFRTLNNLSNRDREIFIRCRENGQTYEEVAKALGISRSAVRKHMVHSLQKFRDAAEGELGLSVSLSMLPPLVEILYQALK
jgi:RNA polymerase sigma-70 factor (family 1)